MADAQSQPRTACDKIVIWLVGVPREGKYRVIPRPHQCYLATSAPVSRGMGCSGSMTI